MSINSIEDFTSFTVAHPHLGRANKQIRSALRQAQPGTVIFLIGPSGVGKSTLMGHLVEDLTIKALSSRRLPPDAIPIAYIETPAPNYGPFSWKEFYRRSLIAFNEPSPDKKIINPASLPPRLLNDVRTPGHELRLGFEASIVHRQVLVLLIDEAQHIARGIKPEALLAQLDYLKSLANQTKTVIVLAGTYELHAFRNLSGQLSRRSIDIHLPRYQASNLKDYQSFVNIIQTFQDRLPFPSKTPLVEMADYLYLGSLGCIGILKPWLNRTVRLVAESGSSLLTRQHLEESAHNYEQLKKLTDEFKKGEERFTKATKSLDNLRAELGLPSTKVQKSSEPSAPSGEAAPKKRGRKTPGIPNPKRRKIDTQTENETDE